MPDARDSNAGATTAAAGDVLPAPPHPAPDARAVLAQLQEAATEFEARLGFDQETVVQVLSFGQAVLVHQPEVRCVEPALIRLDGVDGEGRPVQVLQHVSQLSLALITVPRRGEARVRIRFRA